MCSFSPVLLYLLAGSLISLSSGVLQGYSSEPVFSTLTSYDAVRGNFKQFKDCSAEKVWLFTRHGTRYPHRREVKDYKHMNQLRDIILENHNKHHRGTLGQAALDLFRVWSLEAEKQNAGLLTRSGVKEMQEYGRRLLKQFPHLLAQYSPDAIKINVTSKERTHESARAFTSGLYGKPVDIHPYMVDDHLLQIGRKCRPWKDSKNRREASREVEAFRNGTFMAELVADISATLGFLNHLDIETLTSMYKLCGYESAWHHDKMSAWCTPFDMHHLKVMEYMKDLKKYYRSAYGNPLTVNLGCELLRDMVESITNEKRNATLYFSHDGEVRMLLVALGIGEDKIPPTAANYPSMDKRKWRTSLLIPFSANIASVLYRCPGGSYGITEEARIAVFVNEKVVKLPKCGGREMCGRKEFLEAYASLLDPQKCNRDFCRQTSKSNPPSSKPSA